MAVKIVTDSTADLPVEIVKKLDIEVVPLNLHFGTTTFKDGIDISVDDFYDRLINTNEFPTTSQPSVGDFLEKYKEIIDNSDGIVSIHISSKLSGTFNSAIQARDSLDSNNKIEVIDTGQVSMGVGLVAKACAEAAIGGATIDEVTNLSKELSMRTECFAAIDNIEYLRRGGRIGRAAEFIGTLLKLKPMIMLKDGLVDKLGRARTFPKAIASLENIVRDYGSVEALSVMYSTTTPFAEKLSSTLDELLPEKESVVLTRLGPVIGAHGGPGAIGIAMIRKS